MKKLMWIVVLCMIFLLVGCSESSIVRIHFEANNGTIIKTVFYRSDHTIELPNDLVKEGYVFCGWFLDDDQYTQEVNSENINNYIDEGNLTIYAKWDSLIYTLIFHVDDDTYNPNETTFDNSNMLVELLEPSKQGFIFEGWYDNPELSGVVMRQVVFSDELSIDLYPRWTVEKYKLSCMDQDELIYQEEIAYDTTLSAPEAPLKEGYTFDGWFVDETFSKLYEFTNMPDEDVTIYAGYSVNPYTITFHNEDVIDTLTLNYGTVVEQPTDPTKEGYTFQGWYEQLTNTENYVFDTMPANDIDLYAKWTINQYTIEFVNEDEILSRLTQDYHTSITPPADPIKEGYTFTGWYRDIASTISYNPTTMPATDLTIYAGWSINPYTITLHDEDDTDTITQNYNSTVVTPADPEREGYTFNGWYLEPSDIESYVFDTMPAYDFDLYAKWTINQYTIEFVDVSDILSSLTQNYNTIIALPNDPTKLGYTFTGWYEDSAYTQSYSLSTMPARDTTIYAGWSVNQYTITTIDDGDVLDVLVYDYQATITPPLYPVKLGYTFDGWMDSEDELYAFDTMPAQALTLYTSYSITNYDIIYYLYGATQNDNPETYTIETENILLSDPIKGDNVFGGWFADETFSGDPITVIETDLVTDVTLYARWYKQLTYYTLSDNTEAVNDIFLNTNEKVIEITHGFLHSVVLTNEGRIFTWGMNDVGQIGNGTLDAMQVTPTDITSLFNLAFDEKIIDIETGFNFNIAITDQGRIFTWGENSNGQLGTGDTVNAYAPVDVTSQFGLIGDETIDAVSLGAYHGAILTSNHRLLMWGMNMIGQLGDGTFVDHYTPIDMTSQFTLNPLEVIDAISMGYMHAAILTSDHRLFIWGDNSFGQLGDGTTNIQGAPIDITLSFTLAQDEVIEQIVLGGGNSAAITSEGNLYMWGLNDCGQLGNNTIINQLSPVMINGSFVLNESEIIIDITLGYVHTMALTSDQRLFAWGNNDFGQLGDGTFVSISLPIDITAQLILDVDEEIHDISAQFYFSSVITTNDVIYAWGLNDLGLSGGESNDPVIGLPTALNVQYMSVSLIAYYDVGEAIDAYIPSMDGYTFDDWYVDESFTNLFELTTMPDGDVIVYGQFIENS